MQSPEEKTTTFQTPDQVYKTDRQKICFYFTLGKWKPGREPSRQTDYIYALNFKKQAPILISNVYQYSTENEVEA